ncbi:MAG TPA: type VI secretion system tube protein Hcp [Gaiellaceae bacterium]|nr:type VI secretion system tube protein Hcp [Gaiellaceae bacterium]
MAYDAFLKLDDVNGEVQDSQFEKWIEVDSFSWGVSQSGSVAGGSGGGAGKVSFQDLHITKPTDKSSAALFQKCATGQHFQKCQLYVRKAGGDASGASSVFLKIEMDDVLVSSVEFEGAAHGDDRPSEDVTLNFTKIFYEYDAPDGEVDTFSWDLVQNKIP